jgi:RNA polymerase sigma-70 factor (ECF subfamily)
MARPRSKTPLSSIACWRSNQNAFLAGAVHNSVVMNQASRVRKDVARARNSQDLDAKLMDAARSRDPVAFKELMTRYGPRIFRLAQTITRNREDAEEVSQDSFLRAFRHLDTFRGDSRFYTWLTRIAINQSLMKLRTRRLRELHFDGVVTSENNYFSAEVADERPTPEQRYWQAELHRILASAMGELPLTIREVLHLREVRGCSTEETARMLGLSSAAVKSRALRGRRRLRHALTKHFRPSELAHFLGTSSA